MNSNLYFYNNLRFSGLLDDVYSALNLNPNHMTNGGYNNIITSVIDFAENSGFFGNIWQKFLAYNIIESENAFSLSCEWLVCDSSSVFQLAQSDFRYLYELFSLDLSALEESLKLPFTILGDYKSNSNSGRSILPTSVRDTISTFCDQLATAESSDLFMSKFAEFYNKQGVGSFGLFNAFRLDEIKPLEGLKPISNTLSVEFSSLVGYEKQKNELIANTNNFIAGRNANNVMLFGDSGTGKSSCIKAVLNQYSGQKLRMIEIYKHQFPYLPAILREIKHRNYKFIIYMDDLSFEPEEIEYKYLKATIEGGLEVKPFNVLIYATSNRRHLIKEQWTDRTDVEYDDVHRSDTLEEKLSLAYRFGISIFFPSPNSADFKNIVSELALRNNISMNLSDLLEKAHKWEMRHGGLSGRTAQQFIDYIKGNEY